MVIPCLLSCLGFTIPGFLFMTTRVRVVHSTFKQAQPFSYQSQGIQVPETLSDAEEILTMDAVAHDIHLRYVDLDGMSSKVKLRSQSNVLRGQYISSIRSSYHCCEYRLISKAGQ